MRYATLLYGTAVLLAGCVGGDRQDHRPSVSRQTPTRAPGNRVPPEIVAAPSHWVNPADATTLERLRGRVVWLQFNF